MNLPIAGLPGWTPIAAGTALVIGLIVVLLELFVFPKGSGIKCRLIQCLAAMWRWLRRRHEEWRDRRSARRSTKEVQGRKQRLPVGNFPVRFVALASLALSVALTVFLLGATYRQSSATLGLTASFNKPDDSDAEPVTLYVPRVGESFHVYGTLNVEDQPAGADVSVIGPSTISLSECHAHAGGKPISGYARGSVAHVGLGGLDLQDTVEVECNVAVTHRIRHLEHLTLKLTDDGDPESKVLYLQPPDTPNRQEKAEALAEREVRESPASWDPDSMHPAKEAFKEQGNRWPLLDPRHLHSFSSEPNGITTKLHHLEDTRVQSSRILTVHAVITSRPVTLESFKAKGRGRKAIRLGYAIGESSGERGAWCTTPRSKSDPPLEEGDQVKVKVAVIEWGRSEASGGIAVMLNCPALETLGAIAEPARASKSGAVIAPERANP